MVGSTTISPAESAAGRHRISALDDARDKDSGNPSTIQENVREKAGEGGVIPQNGGKMFAEGDNTTQPNTAAYKDELARKRKSKAEREVKSLDAEDYGVIGHGYMDAVAEISSNGGTAEDLQLL